MKTIFEAAAGPAIFVPVMLAALWFVVRKDAHGVLRTLVSPTEFLTVLSGLVLFLVLAAALLLEDWHRALS